MKRPTTFEATVQRFAATALLVSALLAGCAQEEKQRHDDFYTSGSREADQRAEQRMSKEQQIRGEEAGREKGTLYERLGGADGLEAIVGDFVDRALADPRVNWRRQGVRYGGFLNFRDRSAEWDASGPNVAQLKKHLTQFLALAAGGPAEYQGRNMRETHRNMKITNAEFDAAIGDMKATLDSLKVPDEEQKELLAILESTRPQVVEQR